MVELISVALDPHSHRAEFLGRFSPATNFLTAGPPVVRIRQLLALMEAGIVEVAESDVRFIVDHATYNLVDHATCRLIVTSPVVSSSSIAVDQIVDARISVVNLGRDRAPLMRALHA